MDFCKKDLEVLWEEYKRTMNPAEYQVNFSQAYWDKKMKLIVNVQQKVRRSIQE
ncbi:hypothetical protein [Bacillus glycinifermentans]|uniref:hypothetical protein n=1 Tax=Bacillus glycinifermentans TaxID=1664069 RepID=UPI001FF41394|nr:hypothetical protein [Bacillus glycinifermentans]UOY90779.1 hypothetical protein MW696_07225 [Bacillus glycinifermentans]